MADIWSQFITVMRIEFKKTFFARRSVWIYLLALLPVLLFYVNSIYQKKEHDRLQKIAVEHPIRKENLRRVTIGFKPEEVVQLVGQPYRQFARPYWNGNPPRQHQRLIYFYTDGDSEYTFNFNDGIMQGSNRRETHGLSGALLVFASVFQLYFIRLAIFFGCAGIFTNLFRGEMLDKSLHFYLLAPIPRPVLVAGKYVAALLATATIFAVSTAAQFYAMLRGFDSAAVHEYLQADGWHDFAAYMGVAVLACVAYGSIFLAAGLIAKNPAVLAALLLLWESVNAFIPGSLKMASVVFYLQSLSPVEAPPDRSIPPPLLALLSPAEHVSTFTGIAVMLGVALVVLFASGLKARTLEINYSSD